MDKNLRSYLAELVGTFAFVFVSAGAVCATYVGGEMTESAKLAQTIYVALATGGALAVALAVTIPYDGGYLNPALTLTLWVYKRMDGVKTTALIGVQLLGAAVAGGLLFIIFHKNEDVLRAASLGTPHVSADVPIQGMPQFLRGVLPEFCLTFVLSIVIFGTLIDPRAPRLLGPVGKWLTPLWVGLAMFVLVLVAYRWTGAAANPARWFGTFVWEYAVDGLKTRGPSRDHLAYWVGPVLGALLAGGVYQALILPTPESTPPASTTGAAKPHSAAGSTLFRSKK